MSTISKSLLVLFLGIQFVPLFAQQQAKTPVDPVSGGSTPGKINFDYENQIRSWLEESHVPAVGIGIIENGVVTQAKTFGEIEAGTEAPSNTIFNVASLTKPIAALVVLKLIDAGQLSLDEPLSSYWVDPDIAADPRHSKLTARLVLSHQTGFPNWRWDHGAPNKLTFDFDPGTKYQYSGEGFEYLRKAVEKKSGKSFLQLSTAYLFQPAAMNDTRYTWGPSIETRFARWHDKDGTQAYETLRRSDVCAADDLMTTVEDYSRFAAYVLKGAGLSPQLFKDMVTAQVGVKTHVDYGLGWMIVNDLPNNEYALIHTGSDMGVKTAVVLLPNSRRGLVVFTNGDRGMEIVRKVVTQSIDHGALIIKNL